jgi:hypothetical protein
MARRLPWPSAPPRRFPVAHYRRTLMVNGRVVYAAVTNLTADVVRQLFDGDRDDRELVGA